MNEPSQFINDEFPDARGCAVSFWLALITLAVVVVIILM